MSRDACPPRDALHRYAIGELPEAEADTIDVHLSGCTHCLAQLDHLADATDPLVAALRQPAPPGREKNSQLDRAVASVLAPPPEPPGLQPGADLAGYRLLEEIGRGGMGRVYRARHPRLEQEVALKVLRPGMDSAPILARFEAERQALALMDHPGIARVFDGGVTEDGRPFFVMELVQGVTVSRYCDQHRLDLRGRLKLFGDICQAIHHAHQKGVIHRDLKPSNVLVAEYDGRPVPKVIDFGVAKALERRTATQTEVGMLIGTPQYMSPEQADLSSNDVDTRSDIYALGVLLYELLTGDTPITHGQLGTVPVLEVLRRVREEEPPCPSSRLSAADTHADGTTRPGTSGPGGLARQVRGDLDWIVMKCLEKDRGRRYESAAALAEDVRRHLNDEPVAAGPPSRMYWLSKFVRRNRATVLAVSLILLSLVGGVVGTTVALLRAWAAEELAGEQLRKATEETTKAEEERDATDRVVQWVAQDLLGQASSFNQLRFHGEVDPDLRLRTALDRAVKLSQDHFAARPRVEFKLRHLIGRTYLDMGDGEAALKHLERGEELARELYEADAPESLEMRRELARAYLRTRRYDRAEALLADLAERVPRRRSPDDRFPYDVRGFRADLLTRQSRYPEAEAAYAALLDDCRRELGAENFYTLVVECKLGSLLTTRQRFDRAAALLEHAYEGALRVAGPDHPTTVTHLHQLAEHHWARKQLDRAEPLLVNAVDQRRRLLGPTHPSTVDSLKNLGSLYVERRDFARAKPLLTEVLERRRVTGEPEDPRTLDAFLQLGIFHLDQKQLTDAEPFLAEAYALTRKVAVGPITQHRAATRLAALYTLRKRFDRAVPLHREALELVRRGEKATPKDVRIAYSNLYISVMGLDKHDDAEALVREYLEIAEKQKYRDFYVSLFKARLGHLLLLKKEYSDAEGHLLTGLKEMLPQRATVTPTVANNATAEVVGWLVRLYTAWGKPDEAAKWQAKLRPTKPSP
jgi:serine/threonine protein kinase